MLRSISTAVVLSAAVIVASEGLAQADDPIINVVLTAPGVAHFDAPLPASTYFKLQYKPDDPNMTSATVRVWPFRTRSSCAPDKGQTAQQLWSALNGTAQYHELAMTLVGSGANAVLSVRIPPLQVSQRFCVNIDAFVPIEGDPLDTFAGNVASDAVTYVTPPAAAGGAGAMSLPAALAKAINDRFAGLFGQKLTDPSPAANKAAQILDPELLLKFTAATVKFNAATARVPPAPAAELASDQKDMNDAKTALTAGIKSALKSPLVATILEREEVLTPDNSMAGEGTTPDAANYAAIDTGIVAAFPLPYAGGNGTPWVLPYAGLNLYFTPVDRTVPLDELMQPVLQRASLTVGLTATPSLPNRTVTDFGFGFPLVAAGYRVGQFIRATVGSVFYRVNATNPTSAGTIFGVAPFVGMSLDADVIAIAQGKLVPPK